jgi:hypothetical protein
VSAVILRIGSHFGAQPTPLMQPTQRAPIQTPIGESISCAVHKSQRRMTYVTRSEVIVKWVREDPL